MITRRLRRPPTRRGFTLLELVLVAAIVGVIAMIAAPRYSSSLWNYRADAAAQRLAADLRLARDTARLTSRSTTISFTAAFIGQYSIINVAPLDTASGTYAVNLSRDPYRATMDSVTIGGGGMALIFDGFGTPRDTAVISVRCGPMRRVVRVDALGNVTAGTS